MVTPGAKRDALAHARDVLADWRTDYNTVRPHSKLGGRTAIQIAAQRWLGHAPASVANTSNLNHQSTAGCYF